jgi:thiamine transport system substrate-binding protein
VLALAGGLAAAGSLAACSVVGQDGAGSGTPGGSVVLVTHDSFAASPDVLDAFTEETGLTVDVRSIGDAGAMVNQLVLTKDDPLGDAVFGVDTTFASRALDEGVLEEYASPAAGPEIEALAPDDSDRLTAIDYSDVCVNVDHEWFAAAGVPEPVTLDDLAEPQYEGLLVVEDPASSSPGLAFLLATISAFGDGWEQYWADLRDNDVKVAAGWSDAYGVDFSGSSGEGPRPLVVSYASSPPYEVAEGSDVAPTGALLQTCFRQVEYAGVLAGAANPEGARALVDFLLSPTFQEDIPEQMYVYPASPEAELPEAWVAFAPLSPAPFAVAPEEIAANRQAWIERWTDIVIG